MSKVNISSPLKQDEIRKVLEANENPKFEFVGWVKPRLESQYEATYAEGTSGDPAADAKKLIKAQPWGGVLVLRVLNDGQAFTGAKM